jgi:hypothetical protein
MGTIPNEALRHASKLSSFKLNPNLKLDTDKNFLKFNLLRIDKPKKVDIIATATATAAVGATSGIFRIRLTTSTLAVWRRAATYRSLMYPFSSIRSVLAVGRSKFAGLFGVHDITATPRPLCTAYPSLSQFSNALQTPVADEGKRPRERTTIKRTRI